MSQNNKVVARYGIAELYGKSFADMMSKEIRELANSPFKSQPCPFRGDACNKKGGVCSLRLYEKSGDFGIPFSDEVVTMCPNRFLENGIVFSWIGKELLSIDTPTVLRELPFLVSKQGAKEKPVGKIDMVLVDTRKDHLSWCALEMQAVYFSGKGMASDFRVMKNWHDEGIPFPHEQRRPDFRSSGPKRLMPQLQVKVPTIARWGRKTAVVVDLPFWNALGSMDEVDNVSNCDIAWFVVAYQHEMHKKKFKLAPHSLHLTTLDRAVEGLTGGVPTSLEAFEKNLRTRLSAIRQ